MNGGPSQITGGKAEGEVEALARGKQSHASAILELRRGPGLRFEKWRGLGGQEFGGGEESSNREIGIDAN